MNERMKALLERMKAAREAPAVAAENSKERALLVLWETLTPTDDDW